MSYNTDLQAINGALQNLLTVANALPTSGINYTIGETLTGGTWINGKPIYRQVVQITGSNTKAEEISIPLGNFVLDQLIRMDGGFFTGEDFCVLSTAHNASFNGHVYSRIRYATTVPELRIVCGATRTIEYGYAILEYTKAED